jgi:anti-anti-sigma factor
VVRLQGAISTETTRALDHYLRARLPPRSTHIALELSEVTLLSAAGIRVLTEHSRRLTAAGRALSIVAPSPHVRSILELTNARNVLNVYDSVSLAIVDRGKSRAGPSLAPATDSPPVRTAGRLDEDMVGLRIAMHRKPTVARAVGLIQGRYGIPDPDRAFRLLTGSAEQHLLSPYHLARSLLATPAPDGGTEWFPGRRPLPEPLLTFYSRPISHRGNHSAVIGAFLRTALTYFATTMGATHLTEPPGDTLWLELQQGLPTPAVCHLVDTRHIQQAVRPAVSGQRRVVIADISTNTLISVDTQQVLLESGIHALHCTPMVTATGEHTGMISVYHPDRGHTPTGIQNAKLDHAATEVATWLAWHGATIVPAALEHLHQQARTRPSIPDGVSGE